ncbi:hypothetical protein [Sphingomonas sp. RB1R13]|uniref:hypothetical protein n=1 Tax=Sphingomonas sp. RB1R13 TaxID=3096159 RepID=UPI002FC99319
MILTLRHIAALPVLLLGACSHTTANSPSLAPRAAEKIDPRVPVERALTERPMSGGVRERLASLIAQARSGDAAYRAALGPAQRAVGAAGPARSESWISAQVAISALEAARSPTPAALSAIDAIAGEAVAAKGAIGASDLAAVQAAGTDAGAIDAEQRATIASLNARIAR